MTMDKAVLVLEDGRVFTGTPYFSDWACHFSSETRLKGIRSRMASSRFSACWIFSSSRAARLRWNAARFTRLLLVTSRVLVVPLLFCRVTVVVAVL